MTELTTGQLVSLILGSAAIGAIVSAIITSIVTYKLKMAEIREGRMKMALELTRLKSEQVADAARDWIEGAKLQQAAGQPVGSRPPVIQFDPAFSLSEYLTALDEIDRTGRWAKGDRIAAEERTRDDHGNRVAPEVRDGRLR